MYKFNYRDQCNNFALVFLCQKYLTTTIDSHIDINLPNVENGVDFIAELKKPKVQKALQSVTTDLLAGGSKLGINRFK